MELKYAHTLNLLTKSYSTNEELCKQCTNGEQINYLKKNLTTKNKTNGKIIK